MNEKLKKLQKPRTFHVRQIGDLDIEITNNYIYGPIGLNKKKKY